MYGTSTSIMYNDLDTKLISHDHICPSGKKKAQFIWIHEHTQTVEKWGVSVAVISYLIGLVYIPRQDQTGFPLKEQRAQIPAQFSITPPRSPVTCTTTVHVWFGWHINRQVWHLVLDAERTMPFKPHRHTL